MHSLYLRRFLYTASSAFLMLSWVVTLQAQSVPSLDTDESAFLTLINNYRAQYGAGPLQVSIALQNSSTWMSNDMAVNNRTDHVDSLGRAPQQRLAAFGYTYFPWGENIAGGYGDANTVFSQWINYCDPDSSGSCTYAHRMNMLNPRFVVIGIGRVYLPTSAFQYYWTTDFGGFLDQTIGSTPQPAKPVIGSFTSNLSNITAGQPVTLSWNVTGATAVSIDNGIGDVTGRSAITVSPAQSATYNLTATNTGGSTASAVSVSVAPPTDSQPPTTPTLVSATAKSASEVDLVWTASSDNVGVAGYQIIRNGTVFASVPSPSITYADVAVGPSSSYSYVLKAYDAAGNYSTASNSVPVTTPPVAVPATTSCPAPATGAFTGCYYNNTALTGNPVLVRTDSQISFDWQSGSPDKALAPYNFSVRWQGNFNLSPGDYTFWVYSSDGMRLYIDGQIVSDRWYDQAGFWHTVPQTFTGGTHLISVEYYQHTGDAVAVVSWQNNGPAVQPSIITSFTAAPPNTTPGRPVTLLWSVSGATAITIDNGVGDVTNRSSISVSPAQTTAYTLTATNTAGSKTAAVTVTVSPAADTTSPTAPTIVSAIAKSLSEVDLVWTPSTDNVGVTGYQILRNGAVAGIVPANTLNFVDTAVSANTTYLYIVTAFDAAGNYSAAGNSVKVTTPAPATPPTPTPAPTPTPVPLAGGSCAPATNAFTGCYYNNTGLTGSPVLIRTDAQISFDWSNGPPPSALSNNFSVRWQGNFTFSPGSYTFNVIGSDGMRLYIDGNLVIDRWRDQSPLWYRTSQTLSQGSHLLVMEYYEKTGSPAVQLFWQ